jgi:hypothetical protein
MSAGISAELTVLPGVEPNQKLRVMGTKPQGHSPKHQVKSSLGGVRSMQGRSNGYGETKRSSRLDTAGGLVPATSR